MNLVVTTVTTLAETADQLKPSDYRDIYDELRSKAPLRVFVEMIHSQYSIAWWSKYERGAASLTRIARQELRAAVGLAHLPPTVAEAASTIDPDAAIYQVGQATATRVVMVGRDVPEPIVLHLNGSVEVWSDASQTPAADTAVTAVTRPQRQRSRASIVLSRDPWDRHNERRLRAGMTWEQYLAPLLGK